MDKKNSLLIVDDDTSNLIELSHILKSEYKIHVVKDGVSALSSATKFLPDLILLDIIMPDMNGFDVLEKLKANEATKKIPVIFITGSSSSDSESAGLAQGAVDYIRKPFNAEVIKLRVGNQISMVNLRHDLEETIVAAAAASQSKSAMLANMSTKSRLSINTIMDITQQIINDEKLSDDSKEKLESIHSLSVLLSGIFNDLLAFNKTGD
jgi:PleD family two-component response regulator